MAAKKTITKSSVSKKKTRSKAKAKTKKKARTKQKAEKPKELSELELAAQALNANQRLFVEIYLASKPRNGKQSYMRAYGVTNNETAEVNASRLLRDAKVDHYLRLRENELFSSFKITQASIAQEIAGTAYAKISEFMEIKDDELVFKRLDRIPEKFHGAIRSLEMTGKGENQRFKITFEDKNKARELLARYKKMLTDRSEVEFDVSDPIKSLLEEISGKQIGPPSQYK